MEGQRRDVIKLRIFIKYPKDFLLEEKEREITLDNIKEWKYPSEKNAKEVRKILESCPNILMLALPNDDVRKAIILEDIDHQILRKGGEVSVAERRKLAETMTPDDMKRVVVKKIALTFLEKINIIVPHHHSHGASVSRDFKSSGKTPAETYVVDGETYDDEGAAREAGWESSPRYLLRGGLYNKKWNLYKECINRPEEVEIELLKEGVGVPEARIYIPENEIDEFVEDVALPSPEKTAPGKPRETPTPPSPTPPSPTSPPPTPESSDKQAPPPVKVEKSEKGGAKSTSFCDAFTCGKQKTESEDSEDPDPWRTHTRNKGKPAPEIARTKKRKRRLNRLKRDAICHNCSNNFYEKMARRHCKTRGKVWDKKNNLCRSRKKSKKKKKTKGKKKKTKNKYFK